jgi:hypothetical protein
MTPEIFLFVLFISIAFAWVEIQIEGDEGCGKKLPTWKISNPLRLLVGYKTIDGYHFWRWIFITLIFHFPFFFGVPFDLNTELIVLEAYFLFFILEDFLRFVFNPAWGIKKFFTKEIPWHPRKFLKLPLEYWISLLVILALEILRYQIT